MVLQTLLVNKLNQLFTESELYVIHFSLLVVLLLQNFENKTLQTHGKQTNSIHIVTKVAWYIDQNWFTAAITFLNNN